MDKVKFDFNTPESRMIIQFLINQYVFYHVGDEYEGETLLTWFTDLNKCHHFKEYKRNVQASQPIIGSQMK